MPGHGTQICLGSNKRPCSDCGQWPGIGTKSEQRLSDPALRESNSSHTVKGLRNLASVISPVKMCRQLEILPPSVN